LVVGRPRNTAVMVIAIARPKLEGNIAVGDDRQLGFAEFGDPQGRAIFWLHGTPGARRQIPTEARVYAEENHIRLIGIDRPGIGASTPYQYDTVVAFADDLRTVADTLGIDKMAVIGLSGGGPFAHGQHVVDRLPDAQVYHLPGESHLAGLGFAEEILHTMVELWDTIEKS
jgi:hypothetical protein